MVMRSAGVRARPVSDPPGHTVRESRLATGISLRELARRIGHAKRKYPELAKAYRAACTPDIYLFDKDKKLVYRGQFDDSRPGSGVRVTGMDLRDALDAVLGGKPVAKEQIPSIGCNIKWKSGNEPDYF